MTNLIENRQIRVFISSTFRDMQDERNYLLKRTFPKLRMMALERDVTLTELDLRWGITEEESKSGKVVDICLKEIDNSIPFFIGIVGNRYGWIPSKNEIGEGIIERFPSVENYLSENLSVTEMEMQYGVLQREKPVHAFFYFKADEYGQDEPEKISNLKKAIKESSYPYSKYYSIEDLGKQVEESFLGLLDKLFPEGRLTELEKERVERHSIISRLCQNYVKDDRNFEVLNNFLSDNNRYLVVTGQSGLGKSALLANWVNIHTHDDSCLYNIVPVFVGSGEGLAGHERVIESLCREISDIYGYKRDEKNHSKSQSIDKELDSLFSKVLTEGGKPLIIVLDAVNHLIDEDRAKQLLWLPEANSKVKILFSTLENDPTMSVFKERSYPVFELQPLDLSRREQMVKSYLRLYGKSLNQSQIDRIINDRQCENTLVLKTLLDELISFGEFEKLDLKIDEYLRLDSIEDFYQTLLESYEKEFGEEFIRHILSLISLSYDGLKEDEIIDLMGIAPMYWSQFYCSFNNHLASNAGILKFSHNYVRSSVYQRYLNNNNDWTNNCRKEIAEYFKQDKNKRSIANVSYQYYKMGDYKSLHDNILDLDVFRCLINDYDELILKFWPSIIDNNEGSVSEYIKVFDSYSKEDRFDLCKKLCSFCSIYVMDIDSAMYFAKRSIEIASVDNLWKANEYLAAAYNLTADYDKSNEYYYKVIDIIKQRQDFDCKKELDILVYIGLNYYHMGQYAKALELYKSILEKTRKLYDEESNEIALAYNNLGMAYNSLGSDKEALECLLKAKKIYLNYYGERHSHAVQSYTNLAIIYRDLGDFTNALDCALKSVSISCEILGDRHIYTAAAFGTLAGIYYTIGEYDKSIEYYQKSLNSTISNYGENHPETAQIMRNAAQAYLDIGNYETALQYANKSLEINLSIYRKGSPNVINSYSVISKCYMQMHDFEKALEYAKLYLEGAKESYDDNSPNLAQGYSDLALIYRENGLLEEALEMQKETIYILEKAYNNDNPSVGIACNDIAVIYHYLGDNSTAIEYFKKALDIYFKNLEPTHREIVKTYDNISMSYREMADFDNAIEYYQRALSIRLQLYGEMHPDTATNYNNIGICYFSKNDYSKALELVTQAYSIRLKTLGESDPLTIEALNNIAFTYSTTGDHQKSVELYLKGYSSIQSTENVDFSAITEECSNIYREYYLLGEYANALKYATEGLNISIRDKGEHHESSFPRYSDLGFIYYAMGDYLNAANHFLTYAQISEQVYGNVEISADAYLQSGNCFLFANDTTAAAHNAKKAIAMYETLKLSDKVDEAMQLVRQAEG